MMKKKPTKEGILVDFVRFLKTFGVIGLAIALIIGQAASILVNSVVTDMISPTVGLFLPSGNLEKLNMNITSFTGNSAISTFKYGHLIAGAIDFMIIAAIVFILYKILSDIKLVDDKTKPTT